MCGFIFQGFSLNFSEQGELKKGRRKIGKLENWKIPEIPK
jgi:hypothetical protein